MNKTMAIMLVSIYMYMEYQLVDWMPGSVFTKLFKRFRMKIS